MKKCAEFRSILHNTECLPLIIRGTEIQLEVWRNMEFVSTRRSKEHERVTESKIHGDARRGRNVGRRKSGDVPFPRFGGTDRRISRSLRSCGIREEDDSWPAPVARNRGSICPPVPTIGGKTRLDFLQRNQSSRRRSQFLFLFVHVFYLRLHLFRSIRSISRERKISFSFKPLGKRNFTRNGEEF